MGGVPELLDSLPKLQCRRSNLAHEFMTFSTLETPSLEESTLVPVTPTLYREHTELDRGFSIPPVGSWPSFCLQYIHSRLNMSLLARLRTSVLLGTAEDHLLTTTGSVLQPETDSRPFMATAHGPISCAAWRDANTLVAVHPHGVSINNEADGGSTVEYITAPVTGALDIACHPAGRIVAVARQAFITLVDTETRTYQTLMCPGHRVIYSPSGRTLAAASRSGITLLSTWTTRRVRHPTTAPVLAAAWVTGDTGRDVLVYSVAGSTTLNVLSVTPALDVEHLGGLGLQPVQLGDVIIGGEPVDIISAGSEVQVVCSVNVAGRSRLSTVHALVTPYPAPRALITAVGGMTDANWKAAVPHRSLAMGRVLYSVDGVLRAVDVR